MTGRQQAASSACWYTPFPHSRLYLSSLIRLSLSMAEMLTCCAVWSCGRCVFFFSSFPILVCCFPCSGSQREDGSIFVVGASYLSLLQGVVVWCGLPYAAMVTEFTRDGTPVYGVELDLPCVGPVRRCRSFFFWASMEDCCASGYEQAALQAIGFLQKMYGFFWSSFGACHRP